jgi:pyruvate,orthophosphate dikinase
MTKKFVYKFSKSHTDGDALMRQLLGGKGANLAEMSRLGIPVPPGITITTEACNTYIAEGKVLSEALKQEIREGMAWLETHLGKSFHSEAETTPLLVSVRSGAPVSMPGMMDTILNLGLNEQAVEQLAAKSGDRRFAMDSYRRFIQMYGDVVLGVEHHLFEERLVAKRNAEGAAEDSQISAEGLEALVQEYLALVLNHTGKAFPTDPFEQLWGAIEAVFSSWDNDRARYYRKMNNIPGNLGTAVNVQTMVFGNMGITSGTGVCFTRDPSTGEPATYGEYLINAQGEDVVAGIRTPGPLRGTSEDALQMKFPAIYEQLDGVLKALESHYKEMQDVEFTFEEGTLFLLQTRTGKRTSKAGLRIAVDMCREGVIDRETAIKRLDPYAMSQLLAAEFDQEALQAVKQSGGLLGKGLNAGPGAACGKVALTAEKAVAMKAKGERVLLARAETSPEDIAGMDVSEGILTQRGGMTSHAAVVARGMGKPCVVGCAEMHVDHDKGTLTFGKHVVREGEYISLDGSTGEVFLGEIPSRESSLLSELESGQFEKESNTDLFIELMSWVEENKRLGVRANADTPRDAKVARILGAKGIGLCRTEHMFFGEDRILHVRRMILAQDEAGRASALEQLLPFQTDDFYQILKAMVDYPVTIRLLDPPLHEFLPQTKEQMEEVSASMGVGVEVIRARVEELHEFNPMLGHRGCRLGISYPEIYKMQVEAIAAATRKARDEGVNAIPEIMVPLIGSKAELDEVKSYIAPILERYQLTDVLVGTMIEIPRAALTADEVAESAQFFSFGTNDLTQCCMGISRDDCGTFLPTYLAKDIYAADPFASLDQTGVGALVRMAVEKGLATNPSLKLGICGEHGGDPISVHFFHEVGLAYVSCSPYRVPVARLAAAQANLK